MSSLVLALVLNVVLTPGVARPLTTAEVCATRWGRDHRHVTPAMRRIVLHAYGRRPPRKGHKGCCELDHRIPRELGGADVVANLWAEPWPDAHRKDREENRLHAAVCAGTLTLAAAQAAILRWGVQ
jgi:hypothetical protein